MTPDVKGKTWWVVGLARSGCAAGALLRRHGARVVGIDDNSDEIVRHRWEQESLSNLAPQAFDELAVGGQWPTRLPDAVVISPGVPLDHRQLIQLSDKIPIIGEMELGATFCAADLVAITGTNGKSTTTELIAHLIRRSGRQAEALGNLGTPLSQIADQLPDDAVVSLEVSSFQLETVQDFSPRVGMVLNLAPDHLDRYKNLADYYRAKQAMARHTRCDGRFITWTECPEALQWSSPGKRLLFGLEKGKADVFYKNGVLCLKRNNSVIEVLPAEKLALQTPPNLLNALASVGAGLALNLDVQAMAEALEDFPGLAHRQQWVADFGSIRYINDTKATNVHAVCAALSGYQRKVALIVGGSGKGESYEPLTKVLQSVVQVITIGEEGSAIGQVLAGLVPVMSATSMEDAVKKATSSMQGACPETGGDVMLSPACASFDMFNNYSDRGDAFYQAAIKVGARPRVSSHE